MNEQHIPCPLTLRAPSTDGDLFPEIEITKLCRELIGIQSELIKDLVKLFGEDND